MDKNLSDSEPLCDVSITKKRRVFLVENVVCDNVFPSIKPFPIPRHIDAINAAKSQFDKIGKILDYVDRLSQGSQYGAFNALMKALGGTQPEVFKALAGRAPTETESKFCIREIAQVAKDGILKIGHCIDSELDEKIQLDEQHVELSIVGDGSRTQEKSDIPHKYTGHLNRLQGTCRTISAFDILSSKSKTNERVLIFGRPGVGKSTTTQWLARQWALGKWATSVTLLFLVQVRFLTSVDVPITALELLTLYSLYQLQDMSDSLALSSWLKNPESMILMFADGLDEIPEFSQRMINTRKIIDLSQKAHPIDLVVNILRGDLLPHIVVVSVSRPFLGLSSLHVDSQAEVLGLTSRKVVEYVERRYPDKANHILSVLDRNRILLSVCGITFYAMMISRLLSEGVVLIDEEVQTYTRLMAFILVQYISRKIPGSDFSMETNPYLSNLAEMASSGIFQSQENTQMAKLVFDKRDLIKFKLGIDALDCIKKTGIIQIKEHNIGGHRSIAAEFFHLSGQEMLASLHFISTYKHSTCVLPQLFAGGQFDMALMYTFGLHFDKTSKWVDELWTAMGLLNPGDDTSITSEFSLFIDRLWKESASKMKACQLVYEGQWVEKAKEVFKHIVINGKLSIQCICMTAIDILAVDFVCRCSGALNSIELSKVNADATFVKVVMSSLFQHNLNSLQEVDLTGNAIGADGVKAIVDSLITSEGTAACRDSPSLKILHLRDDNKLGDEGAKAVATLLSSSTGLIALDISDNDIHGAGAKMIAEALINNNSLIELSIADNGLGYEGAKAIAAVLNSNTILSTLDVSDNNIPGDGIQAIAEGLTGSTSLTELRIAGNDLGNDEVKCVVLLLNSNTSLISLDISDNMIQDEGARAISEALASNTSLKEMEFKSNKIGPVGAEALGEMLKGNACLQSLDISSNNIDAKGGEAIAKMLPHNTSLKTLDISYNNISDAGAEAMGNMFKNNNSLQTLRMNRNDIGDAGVEGVAFGLQTNASLKILELFGNNTGTAGAVALACMFKHNNVLQRLDISRQPIGDTGVVAMAGSLKENIGLQSLEISHCSMGDEGAVALGAMLKQNNSLKTLNINNNCIGDTGAEAFGNLLKHNNSLQTLEMHSNKIGDAGTETIAKMIAQNTGLQTLDLSYNGIGDAAASATLMQLHIKCMRIGPDGRKSLTEARLQRPMLTIEV